MLITCLQQEKIWHFISGVQNILCCAYALDIEISEQVELCLTLHILWYHYNLFYCFFRFSFLRFQFYFPIEHLFNSSLE